MNLKPKARTNTTTQIMQRIKKNTIKIAYWNANAISNKKQELEYFIQKYKIDAVLVQETHLKPHRKLNLPNHQILQKRQRKPKRRRNSNNNKPTHQTPSTPHTNNESIGSNRTQRRNRQRRTTPILIILPTKERIPPNRLRLHKKRKQGHDSSRRPQCQEQTLEQQKELSKRKDTTSFHNLKQHGSNRTRRSHSPLRRRQRRQRHSHSKNL
jgi:hypothetical protein